LPGHKAKTPERLGAQRVQPAWLFFFAGPLAGPGSNFGGLDLLWLGQTLKLLKPRDSLQRNAASQMSLEGIGWRVKFFSW
jgi:hypothetical protein